MNRPAPARFMIWLPATLHALRRVSCATSMLLLASGSAIAATGDLDTTFDGDGYATTPIGAGYEWAEAMAIQDDGKIVAAGITDVSFAVVRYNTNGSLDTSFDTDGKVATVVGDNAAGIADIAIQSDGRIVGAGSAYVDATGYDFALARYNSDGSLDTSFDTDGIVLTHINGNESIASVAIQSDDKIVVVGPEQTNFEFVVARYDPDGSLDTSFAGDGIAETTFPSAAQALAVAIQADGKIVVAGFSAGYRFTVARYLTGGALDPDFGDAGIATLPIGQFSIPVEVLVQDDGRIVVGGYALMPVTDYDYAVARFLPDGTPDADFGSGGFTTTSITANTDISTAMALNASGQIVLAGYKGDTVFFDTVLVRFDPNGSLDPFFGTGGIVTLALTAQDDVPFSVAIQDDGAIVTAGSFYNGADEDFLVERFIGGCEVCNDGTICTSDSCDAMLECHNELAPIPEGSCRSSTGLQLQVKLGPTTEKNSLRWKWSNGDAFDQAALGSPEDDTSYTLCVYDTTAGDLSLAASLLVAPGDKWSTRNPKGYRYSDKSGASDGVRSAMLKTGEATRTKAQIKAAGENVPMPIPIGGMEFFDQDPIVQVQLVSSLGACWTGSFTAADVTTNDGLSFKAKVK